MIDFSLIELENSKILHQIHNAVQSKDGKKKHESRLHLDQHNVFQRILTEIEYFMNIQDIDTLDFNFDNGIKYTLKRDTKQFQEKVKK